MTLYCYNNYTNRLLVYTIMKPHPELLLDMIALKPHTLTVVPALNISTRQNYTVTVLDSIKVSSLCQTRLVIGTTLKFNHMTRYKAESVYLGLNSLVQKFFCVSGISVKLDGSEEHETYV